MRERNVSSSRVWLRKNTVGMSLVSKGNSVPSFAMTMSALELKQAWHDGTRELVFEPLEFLERLAAMTPRPDTNLPICHAELRAQLRQRLRRPPDGGLARPMSPAGQAGSRSARTAGITSVSARASWPAWSHDANRRIGVVQPAST